MFENLSDRLGGVFDRLTKQGALSEDDVTAAMREVRVALLEADVSLPVARNFVKTVTAKATGAAVTKSITPGQQVVKIVHDELIKVLQGEGAPDAPLPRLSNTDVSRMRSSLPETDTTMLSLPDMAAADRKPSAHAGS